MIETAIEKRIDLGLRGYILSELAKIFTEVCKRPDRVNEIAEDTDDSIGNIWVSIAENRTDVRQSRYLNSSDVDEIEQFSTLVEELARLAHENIFNERIRSRTLRMVEKIAELVREGEDVRELSRRKLAAMLGISKSTLSEDMARLHNLRNEQDAQKSETES